MKKITNLLLPSFLMFSFGLQAQKHAINDFMNEPEGKVVSTSKSKGFKNFKIGGIVSYSETFTQFSTYCSGSSQFDNWGVFRSTLDPDNELYSEAKVSGSNNPVGISCTAPCLNQQIADALKNGTSLSVFCDGNWWTVRGNDCHTGCSSPFDDVELRVDPVSTGMCSCDNPTHTFRPCIGNPNWGGINGATCGAPAQTMTVEFTIATSALCVTQFPFTVADSELCPPGGVSTTIELSNSEIGVNYTLRNDLDNSIIDGPIAGTGSVITFNTGTVNATTTYNILGEKLGVCSEQFCNKPVVTIADNINPTIGNCHDITVQLDESGQATIDVNDFTQGEVSQLFMYTGDVQTFVVPDGVTSVRVDLRGAQGGSDATTPGGKGGVAKGNLSVTPGETLYLYVGGRGKDGDGGLACDLPGGWNGGGATGAICCGNAGGGAGSGGGASDIRQGGQSLNNRVIVAAGGGGAGDNQIGADGGGLIGDNGGTFGGVTATGGTQSAGGQAGGHFTGHACIAGTDGAFGIGGDGDGNDGGGGGAGWYGGGGGPNNGPGAGGSSYIGGVSAGQIIRGVKQGHGKIVISWLPSHDFRVADNCSIDTVIFSQTAFSCDDAGDNSITFTVYDVAGNTNSCELNVTVIEHTPTPPIALCKSDTISVCEGFSYKPNAAIFDNGSYDNCSEVSLSIDEKTYTHRMLGSHPVQLTVSDVWGNQSTCETTVTVMKNEETIFSCETYTWFGKTYTQSGIYKHTADGLLGCTEDLTIYLTILEPTVITEETTSCGSFVWFGDTLSESGMYEKRAAGPRFQCDSIFKLNLTILSSEDPKCITSITNGSKGLELNIFPNPFNDILNITGLSKGDKIIVKDILGKTQLKKEAKSSDLKLNLSDLLSGAYMIMVKSDDSYRVTKIIKQ